MSHFILYKIQRTVKEKSDRIVKIFSAIFKLADIIQVFTEHFHSDVYVLLPIFVADRGMKDIQRFIRYTSSDHFCEQFAFVFKNIVFI